MKICVKHVTNPIGNLLPQTDLIISEQLLTHDAVLSMECHRISRAIKYYNAYILLKLIEI